MGSQLGAPRAAGAPADLLWLDPQDVVAGTLTRLQLPDASAVGPLGAIPFSYLALQLRLRAAGFAVTVHDYDWRQDLDELAKKLAGFQLSGANVPKSSGSIGVTVTKAEGTSILRRTITMRHEKAGWKVLDIGGQAELEKPIIMPRMRGGVPGRRR